MEMHTLREGYKMSDKKYTPSEGLKKQYGMTYWQPLPQPLEESCTK